MIPIIKHFFFDLDKTLTPSRSPMLQEHQEIFDQLCRERDVVIVTGGSIAHIREQTTSRFDGRYHALAQSGNHYVLDDGTTQWYEPITDEQARHVFAFIEDLKRHFSVVPRDENDLVDHRGAQIGYSVIGYHETLEKKYAFDPDDSKRRAALDAYPGGVEHLRVIGIDVVPAGTSGYNFIPLGKHKGFNVRRLCEHLGWNASDCIYVGDALFPGGNDEAVIGVIPVHAVKDPHETFAFVAEALDQRN